MSLVKLNKKKESFLSSLKTERNLSANTCRAYSADLKQFFSFWKQLNKNTPVEAPFKQTLERFLVSLFHKKVDKSTIARKISCFRSFEKYLHSNGVKTRLNLSRPRVDKKLPVFLTVDEVFYLLDKVSEDDLPSNTPLRDKTIFEFLYATGVRCAELVNVSLKDIDLENKVVRVTGKGNVERMVLFGEKAKQKINEYLEKERPPCIDKNEKLFLSVRGRPLATRAVQKIFEMFRKFLKTERPITPHKIRHSFATHLLNEGANIRVIQELLGHKSLSSTEKYTHVSSSQLAEMCDKIHPFNTMFKNKKR